MRASYIVHDYAKQEIGKLNNVNTDMFQAPHFKEFIVNFDETGKTVAEINHSLLDKGNLWWERFEP